jgi:mannose-6-phosphate isomerase-like protein (cupin superfamily)
MTNFELERTYLFLDGAGAVASAKGGPEFWANISAEPKAGGTMVIVSGGDSDWSSWEMHPAGDEVLVFLEGAPRFFLEHPDGRHQRLDPKPGSTVVVPRGAWHRAEADGPYKILFITYGAGTTHRPITAEHRAWAATAKETVP